MVAALMCWVKHVERRHDASKAPPHNPQGAFCFLASVSIPPEAIIAIRSLCAAERSCRSIRLRLLSSPLTCSSGSIMSPPEEALASASSHLDSHSKLYSSILALIT
jgi:hypothetical protein